MLLSLCVFCFNQNSFFKKKIGSQLSCYDPQGQFLVQNMDEDLFLEWLKEKCPSLTVNHLQDTYQCLKEWCQNNL